MYKTNTFSLIVDYDYDIHDFIARWPFWSRIRHLSVRCFHWHKETLIGMVDLLSSRKDHLIVHNLDVGATGEGADAISTLGRLKVCGDILIYATTETTISTEAVNEISVKMASCEYFSDSEAMKLLTYNRQGSSNREQINAFHLGKSCFGQRHPHRKEHRLLLAVFLEETTALREWGRESKK